MDRRDAHFGPGFPAAAAFRCEPDRQLVALCHDHDHHRKSADHLGRHRIHPDAGCNEPCREHAALAFDFCGSRGLGRRVAFRWLGLCWRGNAAGLGGWTFVTRISLTTLQATGMGFFGLYGSTAALATTLTLAINCISIGFWRGTHTRWQLVANDSTSAPTLTDMGTSFAIATGGVLTLFIAAPPNGSSVWARVVDEVSGAVFEQEITADLPANTQFLSPRLFMNNGATAAAVAYDCSGGVCGDGLLKLLPRQNPNHQVQLATYIWTQVFSVWTSLTATKY